jgi:hypothetical protein
MVSLPYETVRIILSYTKDLRVHHCLRELAQIPDVYWKTSTSKFVRDPMKSVKGSRGKSLAWHFEDKVVPLLCDGCGETTDGKGHVIYDCRVCPTCTNKYEYRVISMTAACRQYFLRQSDLPKGARVNARYYSCTLYLVSEVEESAIRVHGSLEAVEKIRLAKENSKQQRMECARIAREKRLVAVRRQDELNERRTEACTNRKRKLDAFIAGDAPQFRRDIDATRSGQYVLGDYLTTSKMHPISSLRSVRTRYHEVTRLCNSVSPIDQPLIGRHLEHGKSMEDLVAEREAQRTATEERRRQQAEWEELKRNLHSQGKLRAAGTRCITCPQISAQACVYHKCSTCCSGCVRHRR